jgi:hypothetical protein
MAKKKQIETGLYTDQRGRITCREHAPLEGSDSWTMDQWKPMKASDAARFEKEIGRAPACETCAADAGWVEVQPPGATQTPDADPMPTDAPAAVGSGREGTGGGADCHACAAALRGESRRNALDAVPGIQGAHAGQEILEQLRAAVTCLRALPTPQVSHHLRPPFARFVACPAVQPRPR